MPELLLVEDEPADASLVFAALREVCPQARMHHVADGVAALQWLRDPRSPQPDLVLVDINMPRMNGHELLAALKADEGLRAVPVVVLSTSDAARDVRAAYRLGAAGYVTKPVDLDQLVASVRRLCEYWFLLVQRPKANS
jgi:CheY-like chemotaxis protein